MDINTPFITDPKQIELLKSTHTGALKYTLLNDFLSKYSFQKDLYALKGLLAALLQIGLDEITDIVILNPIEPGNDITEKDCILDIKLELNNSSIVNIEIQSRYQDFWPERSITYLCRNFNQLKSGESYSSIKPCIQIGILNNDLFKENDPRYSPKFLSVYRLLNTENHREYSGKFEIRVLSLNQLENATLEERNDSNSLYQWARLFKASTWEELKMITKENPMMNSFVGTVMQLTAEEKVAQACEMRRRYSNDIATYEEEIATRSAKIAELDAILADRDAALADKDAALADKDAALADKDAALADKDAALANKDAEIEELRALLKLKD
ncbi:MAG: Rpn family recombination-promoting nuclease/putative transposase [Lachnospiraceae bacterium]|nr:Rpn family recombination-promoting nuclease/putative transposase [Lachnospiraceae bacterium]